MTQLPFSNNRSTLGTGISKIRELGKLDSAFLINLYINVLSTPVASTTSSICAVRFCFCEYIGILFHNLLLLVYSISNTHLECYLSHIYRHSLGNSLVQPSMIPPHLAIVKEVMDFAPASFSTFAAFRNVAPVVYISSTRIIS